MVRLEIPDRAVELGIGQFGDIGTVRDILAAGAPSIIAAELRRMANVCDGAPLGSFWGMTELRMRADELDPPCGS